MSQIDPISNHHLVSKLLHSVVSVTRGLKEVGARRVKCQVAICHAAWGYVLFVRSGARITQPTTLLSTTLNSARHVQLIGCQVFRAPKDVSIIQYVPEWQFRANILLNRVPTFRTPNFYSLRQHQPRLDNDEE